MAIVVVMAILIPGNPPQWIAAYGLVFVEFVVIAGILCKKSSLPLRPLRWIELVIFGSMVAFWASGQALVYPTFRLPNPPVWYPAIMAYAISLPWVFFILLYGIFIPNTWRRCAAVAGTLAAIPLLISFTTGISAEATRGQGPLVFWVAMTAWLAMATAFAVYGSHRIEALRKEALEARKLGQYVLKERLGSGGMGEVYLAEHLLLRRPCAVKLIRPDRSGDSSSLLRFEREVQATATLTHPNTVQIFDYGHAEDGTFYYAMEYLPGLNLEELVKRHGPLPAERGIHLLRQVCATLHEAHALGLVHRDIKPNNIITCERGGLHDVAKLLDFGLVRSHGLGSGPDNLTEEGVVAGTPAYMSPEQADGNRDLGARSDIYSLGAVAYYLLTGQPPFVRPTALQTLIAHACDPPVSPDQLQPDVPPDLQAIVLRCLEKDPVRRFPDARSLDSALGACHDSGLWTEDRAAAWWRGQAGAADDANSVAEATTLVT
jgi:serine/threonine-protein kinase